MIDFTGEDITKFQETIRTYYRRYGRGFPWRETTDPYAIFVSEIMLQQTQTERVLPKYERFLKELPSFEALAQTGLKDVLELWQGLGYNRRARGMKKTAEIVVADFGGVLPPEPEVLITLPMIGAATAGSIPAFAYNEPTVFIETNIRRVFLYFFFPNQYDIPDKAIFPLIEATLDRQDPRLWYYGLMDYGVYLKKIVGNPNRRSRHYTKQSKFEDSNRQVRGQIIKALTVIEHQQFMTVADIAENAGFEQDRIGYALKQLIDEGFVAEAEGKYRIAD